MGEGFPAGTTALVEVTPHPELASPSKRADAERIKVRRHRVIPPRWRRLTRILPSPPKFGTGTPTLTTRTTPHYLRSPVLTGGNWLRHPSGLWHPLDGGQPGLCRRDAEPGLIELERGRLDADDPPSIAEGGTHFALAYPAWAEDPGCRSLKQIRRQ